MTSFLSGPPLVYSAFALATTITGCLAAIRCWAAVSRERRKIKEAQSALTADENWEGAFAQNEVELSKWLRNRGINKESCIADFIRACWSAWLGGRAISLTELHVLVARRERARISARISAGIAGLLLVVGIVGTLSSVHPILKEFQLHVSASGESEEVAKSTNKVNSLINNLGDAFWPSLIALGGTVAVVFCRGLYALSVHRFTLDLDQFAIRSLIPRYRPSSITEEYTEVKKILSGLSEDISRREEGFEYIVKNLQELVTSITPAVEALKATAEQSDDAAKKLTARSKSIADGITRNLGKNSPMYQAVSGFEGIFERTTQAIDSLASKVSLISEENNENQGNFVKVVNKLSSKVDAIGSEHEKQKKEVESLLSDLRTGVENAPDNIAVAAKDAVSKGLELVQFSVDEFRNDNKKEGKKALDDLRGQTTKKLDELVATSGEIPKTAQDLKKLITTQSEVERAAVAAIKRQQAESEEALAKSVENLKHSTTDLKDTHKSLKDATDLAAIALEQTNRIVNNPPLQKGLGGGVIGHGARNDATTVISDTGKENQNDGDGSTATETTDNPSEPEATKGLFGGWRWKK